MTRQSHTPKPPTEDFAEKYKWWILGGLVLLAVFLFFTMRKPHHHAHHKHSHHAHTHTHRISVPVAHGGEFGDYGVNAYMTYG